MGQCFSSSKPAKHSPVAYAANVASAALHDVADVVSAHAGGAPAPSSAKVRYTIQRAFVAKMPDGDTFTAEYVDVRSRERVSSRVRVMAVDCPETRQNFGEEAGNIGRSLIMGKTVTLHVHTTDQYGRVVADVVLPGGRDFASEMLSAGAAWHYKAYDTREALAALEDAARRRKVGLWAFARPQPPWEYRRRQKAQRARP